MKNDTKSIKIAANLALNIVETSINREVTETENVSKNYFMISDNSYSMSSMITTLKEDLKDKIRNTIKDWDTITLARFSSDGWDFKYFTIWFRKALESDFAIIEKQIDENIACTWLTCFSEVLTELPNIIKQVESQYKWDNILMFLTDGYPVTSKNSSEEEKDTMIALEIIKDLVASSAFIGYGNYYNRDLMAKMAEITSGTLIHADQFSDYIISTNKIMEKLSWTVTKINIEAKEEILRWLSISVNEWLVMNNKVVWNTISTYVDDSATSFNYAYFSKKPEVTPMKKTDLIKDEDNLEYIYSAVLALFKRWMKTEALELLVYIGDVYLIDALNNSLSNSEFAQFEIKLVEAIQDTESRFINWRKANHLPSQNKFCLVEFLKTINEDDTVKFYPFNPIFKYKNTTQSYSQDNKEVKFNANKEEGVYINSLKWNDKEINLSIMCKINWTIKFSDKDEEYKKYNLPEVYNTFIFRTYSIITDWNLNVKTIPLSMSETTFKELQNKYVISRKEEFVEWKIYSVDLTKMPVINKKIASIKYDATVLAKEAIQLEELKARQKVAKTYLETKKEEANKDLQSVYWEEWMNYLKEIWVNARWFAPKTSAVKSEQGDFRIARTFELKVAWYSSIPAVKLVIGRIETGKSLNSVQTIMANAIKEFDKDKKSIGDEKAFQTKMRNILDSIEKQIFEIRSNIQNARLSTILWKNKFDNLEVGDSPVIESNWTKVTFSFGEKKIRIS